MKPLFSLLIACLFCCTVVYGQRQRAYNRSIGLNFILEDSVKLAFNEYYDLIEDTCSTFTRYAHINAGIGNKFVGKIKDVSRLDSNIITAEGNYNEAGQKEGLFVTHYISGQLRAKGSFLKDKLDGKWELYYDNGDPEMFFEAKGDDINISDYWDSRGIKRVDNGAGEYKAVIGTFYWIGKLLNGRPDGEWSAIVNDDVTKGKFITEKFKDGIFQKGRSQAGTYTDKSHIQLVPVDMLPFIRAEYLRPSKAPCGVSVRHIISAQYIRGKEEFARKLHDLLGNSFNPRSRGAVQHRFSVECEVNEQGLIDKITDIKITSTDKNVVDKDFLILLKKLPLLEPATVDGVPARQKIVFNFAYDQLNYRFNIRFYEVKI